MTTSPGRLRLFRLKEYTEAVEETMAADRQRFATLAGQPTARAIAVPQLFQTPPDIAGTMALRLGDYQPGQRILEPSAGLGRLYRAARDRSTEAEIVLVEHAPQCAAELYRETAGDQHVRLVTADFLQCDAVRLGGLFDAVLMNPPFKQGRDLKHIAHALTLLVPGGRIVALCYAGPRQREAFENVNGWTWLDLPAGSFRTEGTSADVAMIWRDALSVE